MKLFPSGDMLAQGVSVLLAKGASVLLAVASKLPYNRARCDTHGTGTPGNEHG